MTFGRRLRALKNALEKAVLRLRVLFLKSRLEHRKARARGMMVNGEEMIRFGIDISDPDLIAAGHAKCDEAMMILNEIETGERQAPRPASYWANR